MLQNSVTYGPARADMDRCADGTTRTQASGGNSLPAPEVNPVPDVPSPNYPEGTLLSLQVQQLEARIAELELCNQRFQEQVSIQADSAKYQPFRKVCSEFLTPGKIESPGYLFSSAGQSDVFVGNPVPGYSPCGVREIDSLARYHSCLGRIIPYLQKDLSDSFRMVCHGFIIGEGSDCDYERISGVIRCMEHLFHIAEASGNAFLRDMLFSYFVILDTTVMAVEGTYCLRRLCFENGWPKVLSGCYPTAPMAFCPAPACSILLQDLDAIVSREETLCHTCRIPHCPLRRYLGDRRESIRAGTGIQSVGSTHPDRKAKVAPLSEAEERAIAPFLKALREQGFLDGHNHWIKGKHKKAYAGWISRVISYNIETLSQLQIGDLLDVSYILKAASDADGDILVCNSVEKIFDDARIPFSRPPRR